MEISSLHHPFGMLMQERSKSYQTYRFGFQGQEQDDEISDERGSYLAFKYRIHDARLGRFLSVDPLARNFCWNSPYAFSENRVIDGFEYEGLEVVTIHLSPSASAILNVAADVGLAIEVQTGAVYAHGGFDIGLDINMSAETMISISFFPGAMNYYEVDGWGFGVGPTAGEGIVVEGGFESTGNFQNQGVNLSFGLGASVLPVSGQANINYHRAFPLNDAAKAKTADYLFDVLVEVLWQENNIRQHISSLQFDNDRLNTEVNNMSDQLRTDILMPESQKDQLRRELSYKQRKVQENRNEIETQSKNLETLVKVNKTLQKSIQSLNQE